jgi:cytochrome c oxidase subunit II
MTRFRRHVQAAVVLLPAACLLAGCDTSDQNALAPASPQGKDIASMFWWMMGAAWIGIALVVGLLVWSWKRSGTRGFKGDREGHRPGERRSWYVVIGLGVATPILVMGTLFVIGDIFVIKTTEAPAANATSMTVRVTGHQWWWEVQYPGTTAVTANEIHIPVHTKVRVDVESADVIHSFWVPRLNRTIDAIPGRHNAIELYVDKAGVYRGQCDEFCGLQHAHMAFLVYAQTPAAFHKWLANQEAPARAPTTPLEKKGKQLFLQGACSSCHQIRGTSADSNVGPDLTHVGSRHTIAAVTLRNTPSSLAGWIADPQHAKPGNQMPDLQLSDADVRALTAYLEGLK